MAATKPFNRLITKITETAKTIVLEPVIFMDYLDVLSKRNFTYPRLDEKKIIMILNQINDRQKVAEYFLSPSVAWTYYLTATRAAPIAAVLLALLSDQLSVKKPFIMIPLFGRLLLRLNGFIFELYIEQIPYHYYRAVNAIAGFSGLEDLLFIMCISYIADHSSLRYRTLRIISTYGLKVLTINYFSPLVRDQSGVLSWCMLISLAILSIVYVWLRLKDEPRSVDSRTKFKWSSLEGLFKDRRILVFLGLSIYITLTQRFVAQGEAEIWWCCTFAIYEYGNDKLVEEFPGNIEILPFAAISVLLYFRDIDEIATVFATMSLKIVANILTPIRVSECFTCCVLVLNSFSSLTVPFLASQATKMISSQNAAKTQFLFALGDILSFVIGLFSARVYTNLFGKMWEFYPGIVFYIGVVLYLVALPFLRWLNVEKQKKVRRIVVRPVVVFHI